MILYRGNNSKDMIVGGGSYKNEDKHEAFNFLPINGYCYGYVQPNQDTITLERIDNEQHGDYIKDVLVVWTAVNPQIKGTFIVGWYKHATIYRKNQKSNSSKRNNYSYYVRAKQEDCTLLPTDERQEPIPRSHNGKKEGLFGQSNIWYADSNLPYVKQIRKRVLAYIEDNGTHKTTHKKYKINVEARKKVEQTAVNLVTKKYEGIGYKVKSVEKDNMGWDLIAIQGKTTLHIEVKGLAEATISVHITANEYSKILDTKENKIYRLCIVTQALTDPSIWTFLFDGSAWVCEEDPSIRLSFDETIAAIGYVK